MKYFRSKYLILFLLILFYSCENEEDVKYTHSSEQTVIIYMLANNNLYKYALENINQIENSWKESYNGNCIIIIEPINSNNEIFLMEITKDNDLNKISSPIIKTYDNIDPLNPSNLNYLLTDVIKMYPSKKYSLILWSHGTGWLPPNTILNYKLKSSSPVVLKSFGESDNKQMDIIDLSRGIPNNIFNTIIFDACHMGAVEVLYELRNKANYIISSPTEILAQSFPYESLIPILFTEENPQIKIAEDFFYHYNSQDISYNRSATISVVHTKELETLAYETKKIIYGINPSSLKNKINQIQTFDRYNNHIFYDLKQTIQSFCYDENACVDFDKQMQNTILYSAYTEYFIDVFRINSSCGLSCFIPNLDHHQIIINYYKQLAWYSDSGFDFLFENELN